MIVFIIKPEIAVVVVVVVLVVVVVVVVVEVEVFALSKVVEFLPIFLLAV